MSELEPKRTLEELRAGIEQKIEGFLVREKPFRNGYKIVGFDIPASVVKELKEISYASLISDPLRIKDPVKIILSFHPGREERIYKRAGLFKKKEEIVKHPAWKAIELHCQFPSAFDDDMNPISVYQLHFLDGAQLVELRIHESIQLKYSDGSVSSTPFNMVVGEASVRDLKIFDKCLQSINPSSRR